MVCIQSSSTDYTSRAYIFFVFVDAVPRNHYYIVPTSKTNRKKRKIIKNQTYTDSPPRAARTQRIVDNKKINKTPRTSLSDLQNPNAHPDYYLLLFEYQTVCIPFSF